MYSILRVCAHICNHHQNTSVSLHTQICVILKLKIFKYLPTLFIKKWKRRSCNIYLRNYVWESLSAFILLPRMFLSTNFYFEKWIGLITMDLFTPDLLTQIVITSRRVSGLATDPLCGVWGRGRTTCLLRGGSKFKFLNAIRCVRLM